MADYPPPWSGELGAVEAYLEDIRETPLVGSGWVYPEGQPPRKAKTAEDFQRVAASWHELSRDTYTRNLNPPPPTGKPSFDFSSTRCKTVLDQSATRGAYDLARAVYKATYYPSGIRWDKVTREGEG